MQAYFTSASFHCLFLSGRFHSSDEVCAFHPANVRFPNYRFFFSLLWLHYLASKLFNAKKVPSTIRKSALNQMEQLLRYERIREVINDAATRENFTKLLDG